MVGFSKYEFYNKLFGDVILLEVTPSTHTYIYIHTHTHTDTHTTEHMLFIKKKFKKKKTMCFYSVFAILYLYFCIQNEQLKYIPILV